MRRLGLGILAVLWLAYFAMVTYVFYYGVRHDFRAYYGAAEALIAGEPLYQGTEGSIAYLYPPLLAQGLSLVTRVATVDVTALVWQLANVILLLITLWMLSRYFAERNNRRWARLIWILPLLFTSFLQSYWVGQVSVILLFCLSAAWVFIKDDRREWAGALLALAAWIKVFPALSLVYFLWRRDWRVVRGAAIAGIVILLAQMAFSPPRYTLNYFTDLLPELTFAGKENPEQGLFKNSSILGFSQKLYIETIDNAPLVNAPELVTPTRYILLAIMMGGAAFVIARQPTLPDYSQTRRFDYEYALVLVMSLLFGSVLWVSSLPPIFLAYVLLLYQRAGRWVSYLGWGSFAVLSFYFPMLLSRGDGVQWAWWVMSLGFFAIAILWGVLMWLLRKPTQTSPVVEARE